MSPITVWLWGIPISLIVLLLVAIFGGDLDSDRPVDADHDKPPGMLTFVVGLSIFWPLSLPISAYVLWLDWREAKRVGYKLRGRGSDRYR